MKYLGKYTKEGESPVIEIIRTLLGILSTARHVEPCLKTRRPLRKAKYTIVTDSEPVP